jgi:alkylated DNA nucleotide flippase Atl1
MTKVTHLFLKKSKGGQMFTSIAFKLLKGYGIESDINTSPISPRQVLITRKEDLDELNIPYGSLRENIIIQGLNQNEFIPGSLLQIGDNAKIRLTFHCEPCKRIADVVPSLKEVMYKRGILGVVIEGGDINVGDIARCSPNEFTPFSEIPYERFLNFIQYIPYGKVVTYKMVTAGMGVAESYIRAIPKYIHKCGSEVQAYPVHRIVDTEGVVIDNYVPCQVSMLQKECVQVIAALDLFDDAGCRVPLNKFLWTGHPLYID